MFAAPRILNAPPRWKFSHLKYASPPVISLNVREVITGVRCAIAAIRSAACFTSSRVTLFMLNRSPADLHWLWPRPPRRFSVNHPSADASMLSRCADDRPKSATAAAVARRASITWRFLPPGSRDPMRGIPAYIDGAFRDVFAAQVTRLTSADIPATQG